MTQCEDQSIGYAMYMLGKAGRVDPRGTGVAHASNYSTPPRGASWSRACFPASQPDGGRRRSCCASAPGGTRDLKHWIASGTRRGSDFWRAQLLLALKSRHDGFRPPPQEELVSCSRDNF